MAVRLHVVMYICTLVLWPRLVLTWLDTFHYIRSFIFLYHHYPFLSFKQIEFAHSDLTLLKAKEQGMYHTPTLRTYSVTLTLILNLGNIRISISHLSSILLRESPLWLAGVASGTVSCLLQVSNTPNICINMHSLSPLIMIHNTTDTLLY